MRLGCQWKGYEAINSEVSSLYIRMQHRHDIYYRINLRSYTNSEQDEVGYG